jgi:hypothetical protein
MITNVWMWKESIQMKNQDGKIIADLRNCLLFCETRYPMDFFFPSSHHDYLLCNKTYSDALLQMECCSRFFDFLRRMCWTCSFCDFVLLSLKYFTGCTFSCVLTANRLSLLWWYPLLHHSSLFKRKQTLTRKSGWSMRQNSTILVMMMLKWRSDGKDERDEEDSCLLLRSWKIIRVILKNQKGSFRTKNNIVWRSCFLFLARRPLFSASPSLMSVFLLEFHVYFTITTFYLLPPKTKMRSQRWIDWKRRSIHDKDLLLTETTKMRDEVCSTISESHESSLTFSLKRRRGSWVFVSSFTLPF